MANKQPVAKPLILAAVDFSDSSREAIKFAAKLASYMHQSLKVLHVIHDPGELPGYYAAAVKKKRLRKIDDVAAEMLDEFLNSVRDEMPDNKSLRKAEPLLRNGLPVTQILEVVKDLQPAMLVMGSKGRTGLDHILIGSKAERCVQLCPIPVTIVKRSPDIKN